MPALGPRAIRSAVSPGSASASLPVMRQTYQDSRHRSRNTFWQGVRLPFQVLGYALGGPDPRAAPPSKKDFWSGARLPFQVIGYALGGPDPREAPPQLINQALGGPDLSVAANTAPRPQDVSVPAESLNALGSAGPSAASSGAPSSVPSAAASEAESSVGDMEWGEPPMRMGHGFDIHRLEPFEDFAGQPNSKVTGPVVIGGVSFDDLSFGVVAHSDGDVVYHSIVDAIFGSLGLPDIGASFPDTDPRWKGAASSTFMEEAWRQMDSRGYRIGNVDVTIIAETPRMIVKDHALATPGNPYDHKVGMVDNIASLLRCPTNRINVKARTHEGVDAVGEKRAVSCHVVVQLEKLPH